MKKNKISKIIIDIILSTVIISLIIFVLSYCFYNIHPILIILVPVILFIYIALGYGFWKNNIEIEWYIALQFKILKFFVFPGYYLINSIIKLTEYVRSRKRS